MAEFIPFAKNVEVNGQTVLTIVHAIRSNEQWGFNILANHNITDIRPDGWYSQESWLNAFKEIATEVGPRTLFAIGKAIPENAKFPPEINSLETALNAIDIAYHMNHRGGEIGHYILQSFDAEKRKAIMECKNPYPSDFDRGIITTMLKKFKPADSVKSDVVMDTHLPNRKSGAESCTYIITW